MFPIMGSIVLFSLYLVFRYVDKEYIDYMITAYFGLMGTAAVTKTSILLAQKTVPLCLLKHVEKYKITISNKGKDLYRTSVTGVHFLLSIVSLALTVYYSLTKNWIASNILGLCFSINAIQLLSLDSFKTGMILLSGLFFYDIFWVFGTEVMVSVAKNFDAPIKVIWPRDIIDFVTNEQAKAAFAMLGLGDIVIPGIFVALALRFDRHMSWNKNPSGEFRSTDFSKPYFTSCLIAYFLGLVTTMVVMHVFHAAQPALLYLSPACILSVLITGAARGELKDVFGYVADDEDEEKKDKKDKKKKNKSNTTTDEKKEQPVDTIEDKEEESVDQVESETELVSNETKSPKKSKKKSKKKN
ncbi:unnamed protein product [Cunninghamella echinulata]